MKTPKTISYSGEALCAMKAEGKVPEKVLNALRATADEMLTLPAVSVVARNQHPLDGNRHAYASMGPYWWPNPDTSDGLPYVRRDGEKNPETIESETYEVMATRAHTLALAAFYFENMAYAQKAVEALSVWHLDEATYMEPHARFAQSVPGVCEGRGIGLIDFSHSHEVFDAVAILEAMDEISPATAEGLRKWYCTFIDWMLTHEQGIAEDIHHNNHGTWYDVQVLSAALFTGREYLAKRVMLLAYDRRLKAHIMPDGKQPHELERTRALNYSLYNLMALSFIANMASRMGETRYLSSDESTKEPLLKMAYDFLIPHCIDPETSPYAEIDPHDVHPLFARMGLWMGKLFQTEEYADLVAPYLHEKMLWRAYPMI